MKSLTHKLIAFTFVIAMAVGCGSVTDAGLDTQPDNPAAVEQTAPQPDDPGFGTESDQDPIYDKPE